MHKKTTLIQTSTARAADRNLVGEEEPPKTKLLSKSQRRNIRRKQKRKKKQAENDILDAETLKVAMEKVPIDEEDDERRSAFNAFNTSHSECTKKEMTPPRSIVTPPLGM